MAPPLTRRDNTLLWFGVLGAPVAWTVHLALGYGYNEAACSTGVGVDAVDPVILVSTGLLAAISVAAGIAAHVVWRAVRRNNLADPRGYARFMGFVGQIVSVVFGFATILEGIQVLTLPPCLPG